MQIENSKTPFEVEVKRFYLPAKVKTTCPNCKHDVEEDFTKNYLSFPNANSPFNHTLHCWKCEHEFQIKLLLSIELKEATP